MMCGLSIELWREMIYSRPNTKLLNISLVASALSVFTLHFHTFPATSFQANLGHFDWLNVGMRDFKIVNYRD